MKIRFAYLAMVLATFNFPAYVAAQKMEAPKDREPGDRTVFSYTANGKTMTLEENWTALTADHMVGVEKFGGKEIEIVMGRSPEHSLIKAPCWSNGQACTYSPAFKFVDFPLEKGKKWINSATVTGETFVAEISDERVVERIETVKTPAGEFETYKITSSARLKSKDGKGAVYTGKEESSTWVALVSGKMLVVKATYRNSFGEKFSLDLVSASYK